MWISPALNCHVLALLLLLSPLFMWQPGYLCLNIFGSSSVWPPAADVGNPEAIAQHRFFCGTFDVRR